MKRLYNIKKCLVSGFTMLEMTMAIVVIGILASMALPRLDRDRTQEASQNILNAIRYTQHLALMDNKMDPTDSEWQKKLWKISFGHYSDTFGDKWYYTISADIDKDGSVDKNECAIDPANGKYFYHVNTEGNNIDSDESPQVMLGKNYGVSNIEFSGGCSNVQHIAFDNIGRPFVGIGGATNDYSKYMTDDCTIAVTISGAEDFNITISKETGYASIVGQPNS